MRLACVGSNCIDYYKNLQGGRAFAGGGPVNMGVYTIMLGGEASYIGPVGNDEYGRLMIDSMKKKGLDISHVYERMGNTAISYVELINNERVFGDYCEGVLADYVLSKEDIEFIATHDVCVCDLWGKVSNQFKELKKLGVRTAFDAANRPFDEAALIAIRDTDYFFFSSDEEDDEKLEEIMRKLMNCGPKLVIAMRGKIGSVVYDGEKFTRFGIVACDNVVDTMGAGDSYIAGFLYGIISGESIEKAMMFGAKRATETLSYFGAW